MHVFHKLETIEVWFGPGNYIANPEIKVENDSSELHEDDPDVDMTMEAGGEKESLEIKNE